MRRRALAAGLLLGACGGQSGGLSEAIARGERFLLAQQDEDGGIRSETYGLLKPGYSLTAIALYALSLRPRPADDAHAAAIARAFAFLKKGTDERGAVGLGGLVTDYPNYTSAFYLLALVRLRPAGWQRLAKQQASYLEAVQLTQAHGWRREDPEFGGWGFGGIAPKKPLAGGNLNISVTAWVLDALASAKLLTEPTAARALVFVGRCQQREPRGGAPAGGFFFTPTPPDAMSKAGVDRTGERPWVKPYLTASYDGVRALALLAPHVPAAEPHLALARGWIAAQEDTPYAGFDEATRRMAGAMVHYFHAVRAAAPLAKSPPRAKRLLESQQADGSWRSRNDGMKEDDPIVATSLALIALSRRRAR